MKFLSIREFTAYPRKTRETLKRNGKIVLTNNGKPSMLIFDITEQNFEELIDTLNRAQAMRLLEEIQTQSVRGGLNSMSMNEIDIEIAAHRKKARNK
jgi:hypothetical protein